MVRKLVFLGIGLLLLGAVLIVGPTFGFSTLAGDRSVSVSTSANDGLIGIEDNGVTVDNPGGEEIGNLENNIGGSMIIDDVSVDEAGLELDNADEIEGAEIGDVIGVEVSCENPQQDVSGDSISIIAEDVQFEDSDSVSIQNVRLVFDESDYICGDGDGDDDDNNEEGDIKFNQLDAEADNGPSEVTFKYELSEEADEQDDDVTITFTVIYGSNDNQEDDEEVTYDGEQGEVTVPLSNQAQADFPIDVTGDINQGQECTSTIEEGGNSIAVCDE